MLKIQYLCKVMSHFLINQNETHYEHVDRVCTLKRPLLCLLKESINHACGRVYNPKILNIDAILRPIIS